ncbi:hypothetical protein [Parendozoicomonas sp. Alg238-R29]|uniref:hypothetical protein n=1 Tax=Parendozoicomonas sp. Alg238-R29 TaxID=2993446 RepID=UPI00248F3059|nr:hypothetical protein [Parendozoicomonas sp. Alg238-R29]
MTTATVEADNTLSTRYLDSSWSRQVRSLLYHTYRDDPMFQCILESDRKGYLQRIRACTRELSASYFTENMPIIGLLLGDRLTGVAFVASSEKAEEVTNRLLWRTRMMLSIGYSCTENYLEYQQSLRDTLPESRSYLLPLVGIHPEFRDLGYGRKLLSAVHDLCDLDQESSGSALSLSNKDLLPFFKGWGYQVTGEVEQGAYQQTLLFRPRPAGKN